MPTYRIPVFWQISGYCEIKAESLDEAIEEAMDAETPLPSGEYVTDSFYVDEDIARGMNTEEGMKG